MSLSRRCFLLWSGAAGLLATLLSSCAPDRQALDAAQSRCLQAWLETLLPADEVSPGAIELGVADRIMHRALGKPDYLKLLRVGCRWLDQQAKTRGKPTYTELNAASRESIVRVAEQSKVKSLPRVFFEYTRADAFGFYYTQPETWEMLDYPGPPQPRGFMDYTRPPTG